MKTREEIEELKMNWLQDPCYPIEETEDFEEHRNELTDFRIKMEARWEYELLKRKIDECEQWGIPHNYKLYDKIKKLEHEIQELREQFNWVINNTK